MLWKSDFYWLVEPEVHCFPLSCFLTSSVYAEILDRNQQHLALLQIPVAFFVPVNLPANQLLTITEGSPMIEVIAEESNDIWINVSTCNRFKNETLPMYRHTTQ